MTTFRTIQILVFASLTTSAIAATETPCPAAVTAAANKAFPGGKITKCIAENHSFEVKMQTKDKSMVELDIAANGDIDQIEQEIPVASLPAAVTKAFAARYPKATILKAEKQTKANKTVTFEVAFKHDKRKEATFKEDGTFVEEE